MTSNQIAYTKVKEERRANLAREAENIRVNNLNYETQRRAQEVQRDVAHLNAATSLQVTAMNNATQRENAILNAQTQERVAALNRQTQLETASINASTSRYVADTNAAASRYSTDNKWWTDSANREETVRHNVATERNEATKAKTTAIDRVVSTGINLFKTVLPFLA